MSALLPVRRDRDTRTVADLIRAERKPLPPHDLDGVNYRAWALAVCGAEVKHRGNDFSRCERLLGFDRWADPAIEQMGQFPHEARAAEALNWLTHLQAHESDRRGPWRRWDTMSERERKWWLETRRKLWRGFVASVEAYKAARAAIDAPARRAA